MKFDKNNKYYCIPKSLNELILFYKFVYTYYSGGKFLKTYVESATKEFTKYYAQENAIGDIYNACKDELIYICTKNDVPKDAIKFISNRYNRKLKRIIL